MINAPMTYDEGELSEEALGSVAGGGILGGIFIGAAFYCKGYRDARKEGWSKEESKKYAAKCGTYGAKLGLRMPGL